MEGVVGDVGDPVAGRGRAGVEGGPGHREFGAAAGGGVGPEEPAVEGEHGDREVAGGCEGADAGGGEPDPLAEPALDGGQRSRVAGAAGDERGRVGDQALLAGGRVDQEEAVDRVLRAGGAEQQQPGTVLAEGDRARARSRSGPYGR
ncbi:hypothetical protein ACFQ0M_13370 [Kitasatospora aburaviensis]